MRRGNRNMQKWIKRIAVLLLCIVSLMLGGCNANVGVGMSVGVPVGNNGHLRVGGSTWL